MTNTLRVMDVERFATKDGPGIRTTVFLKGCPLHCPWCANPESQSASTQLLWFEAKCTACGACVAACGQGARTGGPGQKPLLDRAKCLRCGACVEACPSGALQLSGADRTPASLLGEVLRDADYYAASGGGVTVSGGEPLTQPEALAEFLSLCKEHGLHTAVETCGAFAPAALERCAPWLDLFLFDVKSADARRLAEVTGADLAAVTANLRRAVALGREVVARVPVIPGFNHDEASMRAIFALARDCGVGRLDLLPYHTLGKNKYAALGRAYALGDTPMLTRAEVQPWQQLAVSLGLDARVGG